MTTIEDKSQLDDIIKPVIAAYLGGFFRDILGDYHMIFISAAILGFVAVAMSNRISIAGAGRPAAEAPAPA